MKLKHFESKRAPHTIRFFNSTHFPIKFKTDERIFSFVLWIRFGFVFQYCTHKHITPLNPPPIRLVVVVKSFLFGSIFLSLSLSFFFFIRILSVYTTFVEYFRFRFFSLHYNMNEKEKRKRAKHTREREIILNGQRVFFWVMLYRIWIFFLLKFFWMSANTCSSMT